MPRRRKRHLEWHPPCTDPPRPSLQWGEGRACPCKPKLSPSLWARSSSRAPLFLFLVFCFFHLHLSDHGLDFPSCPFFSLFSSLSSFKLATRALAYTTLKAPAPWSDECFPRRLSSAHSLPQAAAVPQPYSQGALRCSMSSSFLALMS